MDKGRTLFLALVLVITSLGAARPVAAMPPAQNEGDAGCTYVIPADVIEVNGRENYSQVKPGDTLCIPAGERGNLKLRYLHGEPGKPITLRNTGGTAVITGSIDTTLKTGSGIRILASSFLRITGTGEETKCGAEFSPANQACGIAILNAHKGILIDTQKEGETIHDLEIDHVMVSETSTEIRTRGIAIHPKPGLVVSGLYIHHNYVSHTLAEGIYMGSEPHNQPFENLGKIKNLEVSYNLVEETGYDGIKVKVAIENVKVHHNVVRNTGLLNVANHQGGIKIATSTGLFYNNYVENAFEGIRNSRPLEGMIESRYFNNVVINTQSIGIGAAEEGALIFNNTVISCGEAGIATEAATGQVFDNIVAGCQGKEIKAKIGDDGNRQKFNNLIGEIESIGFVNPALGNYRLLSNSEAIDAALNQPETLTHDYDDAPRPEGSALDIGAFEYKAPDFGAVPDQGLNVGSFDHPVWLKSERGS